MTIYRDSTSDGSVAQPLFGVIRDHLLRPGHARACPSAGRWAYRIAERCSEEPWPGSGHLREGPDADAVAIRAASLGLVPAMPETWWSRDSCQSDRGRTIRQNHSRRMRTARTRRTILQVDRQHSGLQREDHQWTRTALIAWQEH